MKHPEKTSAEAFRQHVPGTLIAASSGSAWNELLVEVVSRRRVEECLLIPAVAEPLIVWVVSGCALVEERELGAGWTGKTVRPGDFFLTTTAAPYELRWQVTGPADFVVLHAYLGLPLMARAGHAVDGKAKHVPRLREVSGECDPTLSMLLELVRAELTVHACSSQLFMGGIAQSLAAHLVRTYAARDQAGPVPRGGLPAFRLRRVTDLLAAHLAEDLPLVRLAQEAGYSTFHFSRLFKRATGVPPSRYLIRLRTERARRLLRETTKSIIEIGLEVGYTNPSHFAQIFRQEVGSTPSEYRSLPRTPEADRPRTRRVFATHFRARSRQAEQSGRSRPAPPSPDWRMTDPQSKNAPGDFQDKVAIVTGAASGIGLATVNLLVARGASVIAQDINPAVHEVFQGHERVVPFVADVSKEQAAKDVVALATERFGRLDILVNNAASIVYKPTVEMTLAEWDAIMGITATGVFLHSREALKAMIPNQTGAIVNVGSYACYQTFPGIVAYAAAKGALAQITRTTALEAIEHGIRVNAVGSGDVVTNLLNTFREDGREFLTDHGTKAPIKRAARPEEIAEVIAFLASEKASFLVGSIVMADGGMSVVIQ